jgi:hydrogenase-4 component D
MSTLILILLLVPVIGAIGAGLSKKLSGLVSVLAASAVLAITIAILFFMPPDWSIRSVSITLPWLSQFLTEGLFGFQLDPLSLIMLLVVVILGFLNILYGLGYLSDKNKEHPSRAGLTRHQFWMFLFIASMIGVAISPNLFQLYIFWEITTLCSWALISHYQDNESLRAGFKALLMTFSGGLFFAIALVILFVETNSFEFSALGQLAPGLRAWVFFFFLLAAWAKSAQIPFYTWLPDAMVAPTTVSMYLHAAAMVKAGVFLIARIAAANSSFTSNSPLAFGSGLLVGGMAVITMILALFLFFFQDDLKKLLAYSTIAHLAYVFFGAGLGIMGSKYGLWGGIMHIMNHGIGKALLFLCVGAISYTTGTRSIKQLSGLAKTSPVISVTFLVGMFAILGIPPFSGFWSKFYLLIGSIDVGGGAGYLLLIPFLVEIIVAFAWFLHVGQKVFWGTPSEIALQSQKPPVVISFSLITLSILTIVVPFVALLLLKQFSI